MPTALQLMPLCFKEVEKWKKSAVMTKVLVYKKERECKFLPFCRFYLLSTILKVSFIYFSWFYKKISLRDSFLQFFWVKRNPNPQPRFLVVKSLVSKNGFFLLFAISFSIIEVMFYIHVLSLINHLNINISIALYIASTAFWCIFITPIEKVGIFILAITSSLSDKFDS